MILIIKSNLSSDSGVEDFQRAFANSMIGVHFMNMDTCMHHFKSRCLLLKFII